MSISRPASISDCQPGGVTFFMYGWMPLLNEKMSITSTSFAVRRVCVAVPRSLAFTTDMSIVTPGLAAMNSALKAFMKSTNGGFWWARTRIVPDSAGAALSAGAADSPAAGVAAGACGRRRRRGRPATGGHTECGDCQNNEELAHTVLCCLLQGATSPPRS